MMGSWRCCAPRAYSSRLSWVKERAPTPSLVRFVPCVDGSRLASQNFTSQRWSVQPCVRPVSAVRMTAGHNALRGSGPGQKPAFDDALARVGCPDRRIDRLCITCCSPSQPSTSRRLRRDLFTPQARPVLCNARPEPSSPKPFWRACWRARWRQPWSDAAPTMRSARADALCHGSWHSG